MPQLRSWASQALLLLLTTASLCYPTTVQHEQITQPPSSSAGKAPHHQSPCCWRTPLKPLLHRLDLTMGQGLLTPGLIGLKWREWPRNMYPFKNWENLDMKTGLLDFEQNAWIVEILDELVISLDFIKANICVIIPGNVLQIQFVEIPFTNGTDEKHYM